MMMCIDASECVLLMFKYTFINPLVLSEYAIVSMVGLDGNVILFECILLNIGRFLQMYVAKARTLVHKYTCIFVPLLGEDACEMGNEAGCW